jgi:hypothetical protein
MLRSFAVALILLTLSGCLTPVTTRLDAIDSQLQTANLTLQETNQLLGRLGKLEDQLRETNAKLLNVEQSLKRISG